jgi:hypothetical protein
VSTIVNRPASCWTFSRLAATSASCDGSRAMGRITGLVSLLVLLSVVATPRTAFAAPWSAPVNVSSSALFIENPSIDFGHSSSVGVAKWGWIKGAGADAQSGVRIASQTASGSFGPEQAVPQPLAVPFVYSNGHVFWLGEERIVRRRRELSRVRVAFGRADGRIGRLRTVDTVETFGTPAVDVNGSGQIALAYIQITRSKRRTAKLFVSRGRVLGRPRLVSRRGGVNAVTVAVGSSGDIVVAWERGGRIEARIRRPGQRLGRVIRVGTGAKLGTRLRAAVSSSGRVWIAWASQKVSEGGSNGPFELQTSVSSAKRSIFRRPLRLDRYDRRASDEESFALSLDLVDQGLLAWSSFDGQNFRARLASMNRRGTQARFTTLSKPGYDAAVGNLATTLPAGHALVVWSRLESVGELGDVVFAGDVVGSAYAGEEQVSVGDRARKPAVAFNPQTDRATVVWSQREGPDGPSVPRNQIRTFVRASTRSATFPP